jgi:hypothetical protein
MSPEDRDEALAHALLGLGENAAKSGRSAARASSFNRPPSVDLQHRKGVLVWAQGPQALFGDELCEVGARACKRRVAKFDEAHFEPGIGEAAVDFAMEFVDNLSGGVLGRAYAEPKMAS